MRSVHGLWGGVLLLAGCGEDGAVPDDPGAEEPVVAREWKTKEWTMARGWSGGAGAGERRGAGAAGDQMDL